MRVDLKSNDLKSLTDIFSSFTFTFSGGFSVSGFLEIRTNTGKLVPDAVRHRDRKKLIYRQRGPARFILLGYNSFDRLFNRNAMLLVKSIGSYDL